MSLRRYNRTIRAINTGTFHYLVQNLPASLRGYHGEMWRSLAKEDVFRIGHRALFEQIVCKSIADPRCQRNIKRILGLFLYDMDGFTFPVDAAFLQPEDIYRPEPSIKCYNSYGPVAVCQFTVLNE